MSFRNRLTFFFILLVILPVLAVALVGVLLVRESEEGKSDAGLEQAQTAAKGLYQELIERARIVSQTVRNDQELAVAVRDGDRGALQARLEDLADRGGAERVRLKLRRQQQPIEAGTGAAVAPADSRIVDAGGRLAGRMRLSVSTAEDYARVLRRVTGLNVLVTQDGQYLAGNIETDSARGLPLQGDAEVEGENYRVTGFETPGFDRGMLQVRVLEPEGELDDEVWESALFIGLILLAFLICALAFALTAARSLQSQIGRLLTAARNIGKGDFSIEVPTEGNDEFAALGKEFNSMARQLETRLEELQLERARLQETVRRVGESLGKGLDRDALLGIVVQTAVDGVGAECGRVVMRHGVNGALSEAARAGNISSYMAAVHAAEAAALEAGEAAETQISGANALARPLNAPEPDEGVLGVISIARPGRPFSQRQRELFEYLTNQAAISIENVDLHETIQRQAVTDELTGLFNHRRFQEVIAAEVERTRRFGQELGLIMLDIDNFKRVNDTYGHLQGDVVLREVAHVLRESSREIDEPARYGGEEMAVALPQTGLQGAYEFAERVRQRIEGLQMELLEGDGMLRVTASFGVASLPHSAKIDKDALVAAADAALYRAKRSGKNRTVKAE
ncbi:MAG TPA: diguanylate cyclase [Solirubrobacteraceae bacterium]|nr:diguanylate cyclase [Solirubrobacteraceae bacterium]